MNISAQLALFHEAPPQTKSAEQLAYEAWPFPGLSWERYSELRVQHQQTMAALTAERKKWHA